MTTEQTKPVVEEPEKFCCDCSKSFNIDNICRISTNPNVWRCLDCNYKKIKNENGGWESDEEAEDEDETPCCAFCGKDAGVDAIEHSKWEDLWFCNESCLEKYE